jgi:hypothetical protein
MANRPSRVWTKPKPAATPKPARKPTAATTRRDEARAAAQLAEALDAWRRLREQIDAS